MKSGRTPNTKLPVSSCGVLDGFTSSRLQCVAILKSVANQGHLPVSLRSWVFTGAQSHTAYIADLWSPAPLEVGTNMAGSKAPTEITVRLASGQIPQANGDTPVRWENSGPSNHLPIAKGKVRSLSDKVNSSLHSGVLLFFFFKLQI